MSSEDKDALFVVEGPRCRGTSDVKFVGGRADVGVKGKGPVAGVRVDCV
jgi:hypothetical protein